MHELASILLETYLAPKASVAQFLVERSEAARIVT